MDTARMRALKQAEFLHTAEHFSVEMNTARLRAFLDMKKPLPQHWGNGFYSIYR